MKKISVIIFLLLVSLLPFLLSGKGPLLLIPFATCVLILYYGSFFIGSNFYVNAVCRGAALKKQVALTFDDGPDGANTPGLLDVLERHKVKAAFFCIGVNIEKNRELLRQITARGHIAGNHSYGHSPFFNFCPAGNIRKDIEKNRILIKEVTGKNTRYFRPPNGVTNFALKKALKGLSYTVIGWNARAFDTVFKNRRRVVRKLLGALKPGGILLLHDINGDVISIAEELIAGVKERGYEIVPLDTLIGIKPYE